MSEGPTRVLVVDDHPVFRHGLRQIIEADHGFRVIGEAGDGETALELAARLEPDVLLVDLNLPRLHGLDVVRGVRDRTPSPLCLVLTMNADEASFNAAMDAGASGYLIKDEALDVVVLGLRVVAAGGSYVSPQASQFLLKRRQRATALRERKTGLASLTPTERRVLQLVSENKTNREIAADLFVSPRTIETHRTNLCRKLELQGAHKLLEFAITHRSELST